MPGIMHLDEVCGLVLLSQHAAAETHNKLAKEVTGGRPRFLNWT